MPETDDMELLRQYAEHNSEQAFAALVSHHVDKVYSVALRHVGNPSEAEDIAQAVFLILARRARCLSRAVVLSGWLYTTARLAALTYVRSEARRRAREQEADMQNQVNETELNPWAEMAPYLDAAMAALDTKSRNAVVLRYFDGASLKEVATAMQTSEDAVQKRISRALDKLRAHFARRGLKFTATAISGATAAHAVQAAPVGLVSAAASAALGTGVATSGSPLALVQATLNLMSWVKWKIAVCALTVALVTGSGIAIVVWGGSPNHLTAKEILEQVRDKYAALSSYSDTGRWYSEPEREAKGITTNITRLARPNLYLLAAGSPEAPTKGTAFWHSGDNVSWLQTGADRYTNALPSGRLPQFHVLFPSAPIPCTFFDQRDRDSVGRLTLSSNLSRLDDERIRGVDCYKVLATAVSPGTGVLDLTFWIGKGDLLIHQERYTVAARPTNRSATGAGTATKSPQSFTNITSSFIHTHENISINKAMSKRDFIDE